ncbi:hypothetical protein, partial [Plantibacter sp. YIM 135249]|uniref:hypothetical protein n=1 Tax=Plantibacter sp. YIM 135249 TaxID=3423918 RepID=UPI003D3375E2
MSEQPGEQPQSTGGTSAATPASASSADGIAAQPDVAAHAGAAPATPAAPAPTRGLSRRGLFGL